MFRTVRTSDPAFESDHLQVITVKTPNLKGRGDICTFVPSVDPLRSVPLVILLHGVYGSAWSWPLSGGVHIKAWEMIQAGTIKPMVIAMPSDGLWGDGSAYIPHDGYDFEKWIVEDVPNAVMEIVEAVDANSPMFISGLSMGGFGALRLGAKYGNKFKAISAHSAITDIQQMPLFVEEPLTHYQQKDRSEESVAAMIMKRRDTMPPLRFDCGKEDLLIEYNRALHSQLKEAGISHLYEELPGAHEWPYWRKHIEKSLKFFDQQANRV